MSGTPAGLLSGPLNATNQKVIKDFVDKIPVASWDDAGEVIMGSGKFRYRLDNNWAKLPHGWSFNDVGAVAVDKDDRVYVFNREEHPLIVFDRDGNVLDHWGEGVFKRAHGLHIGPDGMLYMTDDGDHCVRKATPDGKILFTLGTPGRPSGFMSGDPFCRCTDVALSPKGEIYVSDGYYNARVHKYSPDGKLQYSWGTPGTRAGQFSIPHNICCDPEGWVYVADRENHRVQIFDGNGKYEAQWNNMHRASALERQGGAEEAFFIGELGPQQRGNRHIPHLGPRISIVNRKGELLSELGQMPAGDAPDRFIAPHGLAVDSRGDIYLGEVGVTFWAELFPNVPQPPTLRTLRKFVRLPA